MWIQWHLFEYRREILRANWSDTNTHPNCYRDRCANAHVNTDSEGERNCDSDANANLNANAEGGSDPKIATYACTAPAVKWRNC
jgi:hypothetical protein